MVNGSFLQKAALRAPDVKNVGAALVILLAAAGCASSQPESTTSPQPATDPTITPTTIVEDQPMAEAAQPSAEDNPAPTATTFPETAPTVNPSSSEIPDENQGNLLSEISQEELDITAQAALNGLGVVSFESFDGGSEYFTDGRTVVNGETGEIELTDDQAILDASTNRLFREAGSAGATVREHNTDYGLNRGTNMHLNDARNAEIANGALIITSEEAQGDSPPRTATVKTNQHEYLPGDTMNFTVSYDPINPEDQDGQLLSVWVVFGNEWPKTGEFDCFEINTSVDPSRLIFSVHYENEQGKKEKFSTEAWLTKDGVKILELGEEEPSEDQKVKFSDLDELEINCHYMTPDPESGKPVMRIEVKQDWVDGAEPGWVEVFNKDPEELNLFQLPDGEFTNRGLTTSNGQLRFTSYIQDPDHPTANVGEFNGSARFSIGRVVILRPLENLSNDLTPAGLALVARQAWRRKMLNGHRSAGQNRIRPAGHDLTEKSRRSLAGRRR